MTGRSAPRIPGGLLAAVLAGAALISARAPDPPQGQTPANVDPKADSVLRRMSHDLGGLQAFRFTGDSSTEVVLKSGEKLDFDATSRVSVRRPDKLRSDRVGERADLSLYYNGRTITLLGRRLNMYATAPAPANLDDAIIYAQDKLGLDAPAADLLNRDPYHELRDGVVSGTYVDESTVDGVACDHIAYRGRDVDFQLWVEKGPRALPRKYLIISKDQPGEPEFVVDLRDWQTNVSLPDREFTFVPPPGADRIDFFGVQTPPAGSGGGVDERGSR